MSVLSLLSFSLPILTGTLIVHFVWIDKNNPIELLLKLFLGIGLGLGISSMLYFVYLIFFAGNPYFLYAELTLLFAVLTAVFWKYKKTAHISSPRLKISFLQITILVIAGFISVSSFFVLVNYSRQRGHGDWDAWMIYNRAARFIYRGQETWQDAFSRDMDLVFHADYPPLLALNIASRWDILNQETIYVPMFQGFLFSLASLGLCFGALASLKSMGQGCLGLILLSGVVFFMSEGGRQTADVPMAYYTLASVVFLFFYYHEKHPALIVLAGFTAGLAAWTKNEGILFLVASAGVIGIAALWKRSLQGLFLYFTGLLLPLALLFYFKSQLAPSSEFLSSGGSTTIQKLIDPSRHQLIFNSFKNFLLHSGGWNNIGIFPILLTYLILFYSRANRYPEAVFIGFAIFTCQIMGYYLSYLISPYDLQWHISYSLNRLFVHIYPAAVFLALTASQSPEAVFSSSLE